MQWFLFGYVLAVILYCVMCSVFLSCLVSCVGGKRARLLLSLGGSNCVCAPAFAMTFSVHLWQSFCCWFLLLVSLARVAFAFIKLFDTNKRDDSFITCHIVIFIKVWTGVNIPEEHEYKLNIIVFTPSEI